MIKESIFKPARLGAFATSLTLFSACWTTREGSPKLPLDGPASDNAVRIEPPEEIDFGAPTSYAAPISPEMTKRFEHLEPYTGNIVIGNERIQAVLTGITPTVGATTYRSVAVAFFEMTAKGWHEIALPVRLDVAMQRGGADTLEPQSLEIDSTDEGSRVTYLWGLANQTAPLARLSFSLKQSDHVLSTQFATTLQNPEDSISWALRTPNLGADHIKVTETLGEVVGLQQFKNSDVFGILPSQRESLTEDGDYFVVNGATNGNSGAELFVGRFASYVWPAKIDGLSSPSRVLNVEVPLEADSVADFPRKLFLLDLNKRVIGYLPTMPGKVQRIQVSGQLGYILQEELGGKQATVATINAKGSESQTIELKPRGLGTVTIVLDKPELAQGAKLTLQENPLVSSSATSKIIASESLEPLSNNTSLVKEWPVQLTLPTGRYVFWLFHDEYGELCRFKASIVNGRTLTPRCKIRVIPTKLSGTPDMTISKNVMNPSVGIGLNLYLKDGQTFDEGLWKTFTAQRNLNVLMSFSQFAHQHYPSGLLELTCPTHPYPDDVLLATVVLLQPQAIQTFGCLSEQYQNAIINVAARSQPKLKDKLTLTTASKAFSPSYSPLLTLHERIATLEDLANPEVTIAQGAVLDLKNVDVKKVEGDLHQVHVDGNLTTRRGTRATSLVLRDRENIVWQSPLKTNEGERAPIRIDIELKNQPQLLRLEVLGDDMSKTLTRSNTHVLATSNFISPDEGSQR